MYLIDELYQLFLRSTGVSTDSRRDLTGMLFIALKGDRFDGNEYAESAIDAGAIGAIVDREDLKDKPQCYYVPNTLSCLQRLAHYHRTKFDIPVLGITGTNGKTTTKELVSSVLSQSYSITATQGNLNNHIGVPLTLLQMTPATEIAVVEMGANHPGEIGWLCQIAATNIGLVTNVGRAHLEGFGSEENIWNTKMDLYRYVDAHHGMVLINREEPSLSSLQAATFSQSFYFDRDHIPPLLSVDFVTEQDSINVHLHTEQADYNCRVRLYGDHNILNILSAIAVGGVLKVPVESICQGLQAYQSKQNRSQIVVKGNNTFYLDAYNANPTSMQRALEFFNKLPATDKVIILGDMFELGSEALAMHQEIADIVLQMNLSKIILVGENFSKCDLSRSKISVQKFLNTAQLAEESNLLAYQNTTFLVKGSRSMKLETLVL